MDVCFGRTADCKGQVWEGRRLEPETGHATEGNAESAKASQERSDRTWLGFVMGLQVGREERVREGGPTRRTSLWELKERRRDLGQGGGLRRQEPEHSLGGRLMVPDCMEGVRHRCKSRLAPSFLWETEAAITGWGE